MTSTVNFSDLSIKDLLDSRSFQCSCGKVHSVDIDEVIIQKGALEYIPKILGKYSVKKPFIIMDRNTQRAAGEYVCSLLNENHISYSKFIFPQANIEPNEFYVGQVVMNFDSNCDFIIGVGSGTINDIGKIIAKVTGLKYMVVCTAPSMDGYASSSSSMILDNVKVSIDSSCPVAVVADIDIICNAPMRLLQAGLGDMLAKYVSICEWRISHIINKEYYCEQVASIMRRSLDKCFQSASGLLKRDPQSVANIMEGLILAGIAMKLAEVTRPASGMEHYFSHIWEMRALRFNTKSDLHGIHVGIGTVLSLRIYSLIREITPNREKALSYVREFSLDKWSEFLREFLGESSEKLIQIEREEGKFDKKRHEVRLDTIIQNWSTILEIIDQELPEPSTVINLLKSIDAPVNPKDIGLTQDEVRDTFIATKDIRDKYIGSRLLWDLGWIDDIYESQGLFYDY